MVRAKPKPSASAFLYQKSNPNSLAKASLLLELSAQEQFPEALLKRHPFTGKGIRS
jgi:hypothetical protein